MSVKKKTRKKKPTFEEILERSAEMAKEGIDRLRADGLQPMIVIGARVQPKMNVDFRLVEIAVVSPLPVVTQKVIIENALRGVMQHAINEGDLTIDEIQPLSVSVDGVRTPDGQLHVGDKAIQEVLEGALAKAKIGNA